MNTAPHSNFLFRRAHAKEVPAVLSLISQRIRWMDACGIRQWNTTGYEAAYPPSYYAAQAKAGTLFVLLQKENGAVCCAAVLTEEDPARQDRTPALYLHNFVGAVSVPGAGACFLHYAQEYARACGKRCLRLDSARENPRLTKYYEAQGFRPVGTREDGPYRGILREKELL